MNAQRKKRINLCVDELLSIQDEIGNILNEEEEAFNNIPENLQGSERYEKAEEAVELLNTACDNIAEVIDNLMDITKE